MAQDSVEEPPSLRFITLGTARLPKSIAGDHSGSLLLELVLDSSDGRIVDVATTIALPGYTALLRRLLIGRRLDETEEISRRLFSHCRGPLLKPTIAALTNAASNSKNGAET